MQAESGTKFVAADSPPITVSRAPAGRIPAAVSPHQVKTAPGASASLHGTAAVERELAAIVPPLFIASAVVLLALVLTRLVLAAWTRHRARSDRGLLPEQPLFPPPSHHERLRDPGYLRKIVDRDGSDSKQRRP